MNLVSTLNVYMLILAARKGAWFTHLIYVSPTVCGGLRFLCIYA